MEFVADKMELGKGFLLPLIILPVMLHTHPSSSKLRGVGKTVILGHSAKGCSFNPFLATLFHLVAQE